MTMHTPEVEEELLAPEPVAAPELPGYRVLQRLIFPHEAESDSLSLYVELGTRRSGLPDATEAAAPTPGRPAVARASSVSSNYEGASRREVLSRTSARVPAGRRVSFGTYFNAFPASYWKKWTTVDEVRLVVETRGAGHVVVYRSNARGIQQRVSGHDVSGDARVVVDLPLTPFGDGGWYWFDVESAGKSMEVRSASWQAPADLAARGGTVSFGMTTLNKPDDVVRNIATIARDESVRARLDEMIIVDQGTKRVRDHERFPELAAAMGDQLRIVEQGNIGGSGGFSRGMYEVVTQGRSEYVVLMDDDIDIEPESIVRLATFADYCKRPTLVGAHMFDINNRPVLHTFGERVDPYRVQPVPAHSEFVNGHNFSHESLRSTSWLHRRADVDYNGWWTCLIPVEVVREIGLSMPVFIKWDDAEYGLRAQAAGYPTVSLPGAGVWHMSWIDKDDLVGWQAYFHTRNRLIVSLLYSQFPRGGGTTMGALQSDVKHLMSMQYATLEGRLRGMRSLLAGPRDLESTIATALPEIRAMAKEYDDGRHMPDADDYPQVDRGKPRNRGKDLRPPKVYTLLPWTARTVLRQLAEPVKERSKEAPQELVAFQDARWWRLSQYDSALVTNAEGTGVAWYRRDPATLRHQLAESAKLHADIQRRWSSLREEYRTALPEITSFETWERIFAANPATPDA